MSPWVGLFTAILFWYLPIEVIERSGQSMREFGLDLSEARLGIRQFLLISLIIFPIYSICFHYVQNHFFERELQFEVRKFANWPLEFRGPINKEHIHNEIRVFLDGDRVILVWNLELSDEFELTIRGNEKISRLSQNSVDAAKQITRVVKPKGVLSLNTHSTELTFIARSEQKDLSRHFRNAYGDAIDNENQPTNRSLWWLFHFLMTQLLMVAIPEEVLYRGYIQTRLNQRFKKRKKVFGVMVSVPSILITSIIFAIGHILTIPSPARLAVFFPSLVFGWLREWNRSVVSAVLFHLACNLFSQLAFLHYS